MGAIVVAVFLAKTGCERIQERMQAAKQKKRKGKRKRMEDFVDEDGMGLQRNVNFSETSDDEESTQPIEMTTVTKRRGAR